ncbi:MAG: hypothetical protein AB7P08_16085 [Burkholderiales bacterium]
MRVFISLLLVAAVAFAWWWRENRPATSATQAVAPTSPEVAQASPASQAAQAPVPAAAIFTASPPAKSPPLPEAPPLRIAVLARIAFAGEPPAVTVLLDGHTRTLREGASFGDGFRLDRIGEDRIRVTHVPSQQAFEKGYDELRAPPADTVAAAQTPSGATQGPFPAVSAARKPATAPAMPVANFPTTVAAPVPFFRPPVAPLGATRQDNPLVGAVLPGAAGQAPPGVAGPKPTPTLPGQPAPAGPQLRPVPAGSQGPVPR